MDVKSLFFGFMILALILIETTAGKTIRNSKEHTDADPEGSIINHDLSLIPSKEVLPKQEGVVISGSALAPNATSTDAISEKKGRRSHRLTNKQRRNKRKHLKRARKNKRRGEDPSSQSHELQSAGIIESGISGSGVSRDSKHLPVHQRRRNHQNQEGHHKRGRKHHRRQQRRLKRKQSRANHKIKEEHKDEINPHEP